MCYRVNFFCVYYLSSKHKMNHCSRAHSAYYRSCPKFKEENKIQTLTTKENVANFEALKRLSFLQRCSYAARVSKEAAPTAASVWTQVCLLDFCAPRKPRAPKVSAGIPQDQRYPTQTAPSKATALRRLPPRPQEKTVMTSHSALEGRPSSSSQPEGRP